ncbi:MAG: hypothetical protein ACYCY6_02810 [Minisyncoccota bacterium]
MHHAILYLGERREVDEVLSAFFEDANVRTIGNPDFFLFEGNVFTVDDARSVVGRALEKAFDQKKFFVIHAEKYTPEAQNALLKTFEDPVPDTHFLISARETSVFLPTLLSRMQVVRAHGELEESNEVKKFIKKTPKQRIDFAKKFADEKEERGAGALAEFLDSLLLEFRKEGRSIEIQKKIMTLRTFARDSGAMPRIVLEHLALVLP